MPADVRAVRPTISPSVVVAIKAAEPATILTAQCTAVEESYVPALWTSISSAVSRTNDATNTISYTSAVFDAFDTAINAAVCGPELPSIWAAFEAAKQPA